MSAAIKQTGLQAEQFRLARKRWCSIGLWALVAASGSATAASPADPQFGLNLGVEYFRWQEFADTGERLLVETGPRVVLGARLQQEASPSGAWYAARLDTHYIDAVTYDGHTQPGNQPIQTDVDYTGYALEGQLGYRFRMPTASLRWGPVVGVGREDWERAVQSATTASGQPVAGISENYAVNYHWLGLELEHGSLRLLLGRKSLQDVAEDVPLFQAHVEPQGESSVFLRLEQRRRSPSGQELPTLLLYYDGYRFGRSPNAAAIDPSSGSPTFVRQPRSRMEVFGIGLTVPLN